MNSGLSSFVGGISNLSSVNLSANNQFVGNLSVSPTGSLIIPFASTGTVAMTGSIYFDTTRNKLMIFQATGWVGVAVA
jgi:hypothetical protein